jgi:hypothetical protein
MMCVNNLGSISMRLAVRYKLQTPETLILYVASKSASALPLISSPLLWHECPQSERCEAVSVSRGDHTLNHAFS